MAERYIISIDQSTQGTKALLFDEAGNLQAREDLPHKQLVNDKGWVSHDPEEIYQNTLNVIKTLIEGNHIDKNCVTGIGISNQRETSVIWDRKTGKAMDLAIVWQCSRAAGICERPEIRQQADMICRKTGMRLSPYFPAAKIAWLLENVPGASKKARAHEVCHGTIDSWLVYRLTDKKSYRTDYSNASRTQLFDIFELKWDHEICGVFGIEPENLPEVSDSNALFGTTDLEGYFDKPVPIHGVMGDSHAALYGQGCLDGGMIKATYGTGSSIMMNVGSCPVRSSHGVVTSLAWGIDGSVDYVLEGNLNYTGAVITWLKDDLKMITSPAETQQLAEEAAEDDELYLIPAFTGLGAPYWASRVKAAILGMNRTTGRAEIVRAGVECIAYQIADIVKAMEEDSKVLVKQLRVDGGPTGNRYLMQFQSDILAAEVLVPAAEELSGIGAAYMAGISLGIWSTDILKKLNRKKYGPKMEPELRDRKYAGWKQAVRSILPKEPE